LNVIHNPSVEPISFSSNTPAWVLSKPIWP